MLDTSKLSVLTVVHLPLSPKCIVQESATLCKLGEGVRVFASLRLRARIEIGLAWRALACLMTSWCSLVFKFAFVCYQG